MSPKLKPLDQQVIVITGASSGIGLLTARKAARRGASVMLVARNEGALIEAVRAIEAAGGRAAHAVADVGEPGQLRAAADAAIARFGRIDTWVNNAGITIYGKLLDIGFDEHQRMMRTNYFGVVNGAKLAVEHLRASGGALITVGSIASDIPSPVLGAYAATKHAIKGYINSLRTELAADGVPISVTLIKPSGIDTPIAEHARNHMPGEARIPPPVYDPQLVADAILAAAVRPRREITVGGVGRLQVLVGSHFPQAIDAFAGVVTSLLFDPKKVQPATDSLFGSAEAGRERSGEERPRRFSLYTGATLHRGAALGVVAAAGLAGLWLMGRKGRR